MAINRRTVIKQFLFVSAGVSLLPSCLQEENSKASVILKNMQISGPQERTMAELAETIVPATTTPGAKDISAHLFVLKMMDDCYKKEDQQKFINGLSAFETSIDKTYGKSFYQCSKKDRDAVVASINDKKNAQDDLSYFYSTTKKLTIQAYTTSKFYLTKVQVYKMVPGKYQGCIPVKNI